MMALFNGRGEELSPRFQTRKYCQPLIWENALDSRRSQLKGTLI